MPEGDTIHSAARRVGEALVGQQIVSIETPQRRHAMDRWPDRLGGRGVRAVDAHGKHLFVRFDNDLTLHSHLRMGGSWGVYAKGQRWRRSPRRAWLVIRTERAEVVQFDGPVLELVTDSRTRFDQRLAALGPDILAEELDEGEYLRRLRAGDQTRGIGEALIDQRTLAGIGNLWKSEGCFIAGLDPWRPTGDVSDAAASAVVRECRAMMQEAVEQGLRDRKRHVYNRAGLPCPSCHSIVMARGQGDDNRTTFWCPSCQA